MSFQSDRKNILELFETKSCVSMCAPMVRYSKLPFRMLVRKYYCDVAFTPMMISHSFLESAHARDSDFTTCYGDRPLIAQFAAKNGTELAECAELIYSQSDGIDLNCGCPQRWAISDGYGACLLEKPETVQDMIYQVRNRISDSRYTVSLKIRIHDDIRKTIEYCKRAEQAGISFISVHGRTKLQRNEPVNIDAIKLIKENVSIPVVGNGDVFHLDDVVTLQEATGVNGNLLYTLSNISLKVKQKVLCVPEVYSKIQLFLLELTEHLLIVLQIGLILLFHLELLLRVCISI